VNVLDLNILIDDWGPCLNCLADMFPEPCNGVVDVDDLLVVLNSWGPCSAPGSEDVPEHIQGCVDFCSQYTGTNWEHCMNGCVHRVCHYHPEECE
jgi:hypothetical protein